MVFGSKESTATLLLATESPHYKTQQLLLELSTSEHVTADLNPEATDRAWERVRAHAARCIVAWAALWANSCGGRRQPNEVKAVQVEGGRLSRASRCPRLCGRVLDDDDIHITCAEQCEYALDHEGPHHYACLHTLPPEPPARPPPEEETQIFNAGGGGSSN